MELSLMDTTLSSATSTSPKPNLLASFRPHHPRSTSTTTNNMSDATIPHRGALTRVHSGIDMVYVIEIATRDSKHILEFGRSDFEALQRLFSILDTESRGLVDRTTVKEFVTLRCPVFWRRDEDLGRLTGNLLSTSNTSPTFDEIWSSVVHCSRTTMTKFSGIIEEVEACELGVEGWLVFCRFITLAQYLEGKRRFSARHLQQTMRHRNSPRGSEVVVVDVPPPEAPAPLSADQLADYEKKSKTPLPPPELDLDHSLLAAHDTVRRRAVDGSKGSVKINLFGSSFSSTLLPTTAASVSHSNLEFAVTYSRRRSLTPLLEDVVVRRSMADMKWLDDTFISHKVLGGTLCGRILPPFPGSGSRLLSSHFQKEDSVLKTSIKNTGGAINAAASGVGRIRDAAKSFFGNRLAKEGVEEGAAVVAQPKKVSKRKVNVNLTLPENYYNPNSPAGKARHLERYLNYLLEHPALSTSFPLNTILKASQSGLEAAKQSLEECTRASKELKEQTPQLDDGKILIPFWPAGAHVSHTTANFAWVRTAAQAAMALKVHGMLETTGLQSASARLQHASLPSFGSSARTGAWEDDEGQARIQRADGSGDSREPREENNFEQGVVTVGSELPRTTDEEQTAEVDDGYDLLPLPVPAPERTILSAGSGVNHTFSSEVKRETRFHYGTASGPGQLQIDEEEDTATTAFLGDISVDENIDKLREVIGSVDNTLSRCLSSSGGIGKAQRETLALHLDVVRGLDSWGGMRGKFVSQRSLLRGVAGIEQSKEIYDESGLALIDDLSWQTSLAASAVSAAEDVRSAVRVSRTAASAKAAASSAAFAAQHACETTHFADINEARATQTRASIAQSHAIHAAVVDHEAKTVKRRATLALAHDVKCWNVHRKREMLRSCIAYARSQHEATRRAVDAWSSLRDGFIGTTVIPSAPERKPLAPAVVKKANRSVADPGEMSTTIYEDDAFMDAEPSIVAVDHHILTAPTEAPASRSVKPVALPTSDLILPFATAAPIPEEEEDQPTSPKARTSAISSKDLAGDAVHQEKEVLSASMQSLVDGLMSWGGGFEAEEDHFALPAGVAASIALEESGALGTKIV